MLNPKQAKLLEGDLFDEPAKEDEAAPPAADAARPAPDSIGGYRVIGQIGRGGMGTIYEAEQDSPRRRVAIKLMRAGMTSRAMLQRFRHEAEILGHLRHPNIAHVYEAGSFDDGSGARPYFVMEFIPDATPITRFAEVNGLSIEERLELFVQVCDAVAHGHQKGIIHRDLSPANIVVEPSAASPSVKVIDFGIARSTDADVAVTTIETFVGELIGTLQYMSPEQCEGKALDIDVRSDVYTLGVVLYELLTGHVPYDLSYKSLPSATRIIQETLPPQPSTFVRRLRGDLDTIIGTAIEKEPVRRYQSVVELSADVRRHRDGDPIEAKSPGPWLRLMKFSTRHPVMTTSSLCAMCVLVTLLSIAIVVPFLNSKPHRLQVADSERVVHIQSISGRILETWDTQRDDGVHEAAIVSADDGRQLVCLGLNYGPNADERPGVMVYDINDLSDDIWRSEILAEAIESGHVVSQFRLGHAEVVDIFAEVPGPEFLAVHQSPDASCMLRIYDIRDGAVLYEAWHTGNILDTHWLEKPRRLIVSALGARLDVPGDDDAYSNILFALNPSIHEHGWVRDSREPSEPSVAWYGILGPAQSVALFDPARFHTPEHTEAIGSVVDVGLRLRAVNGVGSVILRLTADGTIVDDACRHNDAYNPMGLPDPTGFDMEMIRVERLDDAG